MAGLITPMSAAYHARYTRATLSSKSPVRDGHASNTCRASADEKGIGKSSRNSLPTPDSHGRGFIEYEVEKETAFLTVSNCQCFSHMILVHILALQVELFYLVIYSRLNLATPYRARVKYCDTQDVGYLLQ